ncbi:MAG: single-stranded DNA-binding protein [Bacteroidota bacterium]|jgi:single-strand DNA-binding protein|nr:single-stranded DNA-binding protein [Bacteroidota bacterium]
MADLKMPELNYVLIVGNLTKDPIFRTTSNNTPVVNFSIASNRRYKDRNNSWQEDVCYIGIVAWNKLAESCHLRLRKGSAVLIEGELQTRTWRSEDGSNRSILEVKARRIQFLNKNGRTNGNGVHEEDDHHGSFSDEEDGLFELFDGGDDTFFTFDVERVTANHDRD